MKNRFVVFFLTVLILENLGCKKDNSVVPSNWDLSGKIVFNPQRGGLSGIYVVDLNSSALSLLPVVTNGDEPRVNSDGTEIAYSGSLPGMIDIFKVNLTDNIPTNLTPSSSFTDSWPDWSPDGSSIVFNRVIYHPTIKVALYVMNHDGNNLRIVTDTASLQASVMPRWSPDGSTIAFVGRLSSKPPFSYSLYFTSSDGSNQVLQDLVGDRLPSSLPSWSQDSRKIAYEKIGEAIYDTTGKFIGTTGGLFVLDIVSRVFQKISVGGSQITPQGSSWLSDGRLICVGMNTATNSYEVYAVSLSNSLDTKLLAKGFKTLPATTPSPDGKHVAIFGTANQDKTFALYVVGTDGTGFQKLKDIDDQKTFIVNWQYCQWIK